MRAAGLLGLLLGACSGGTAGERLSASAAGRCGELGGSAVAVPCWTALALESAGGSDEAGVVAACGQISRPLWRDECLFQGAERLGLEGDVLAAARTCALAGRFSDFCGLHLAWWARPFPLELTPADPGAGAAVQGALAELDTLGTSGQTAEMLRASVWFDLYYGSGHTDAGPALAADSPLARTAWAHEVVRLEGDASAWDRALTGPGLEPRCWRGRVVEPGPSPSGAPQVPLVHGGLRLVGQDLQEDLEIAILEARYFHGLQDLDPVRAALLDPRERLRWTAGRVLARSLGHQSGLVKDLLAGEPRLAAEAHSALTRPSVEWEADPRCRTGDD